MIQLGSAFSREYALGIKLEPVSSIDRNSDRVLSNCSLESNLFVGSHLGAVFDLPDFHSAVVFAGLGPGCVFLLVLSGDSVVNNVPEGPGHVSSIASFISVGL